MKSQAILEEILALGAVRVQKIWGIVQAIIFEIYSLKYKRLYLICDYGREHPSFHVQLEKPESKKIIQPTILALRKYLVGQSFNFEYLKQPEQVLRAHFLINQSEVSVIFDLRARPQIGLFVDRKLIAQSGQNIALEYGLPDNKIIVNKDLNANFAQAEIYNKKSSEYLRQQIFLKHQREFNNNIKKLENLKHNLSNDLEKFQHKLELEQEAELLRVNLHKIKKGDKQILLIDYTLDPPREKLLYLDPSLSPQEALAKIFNQIKKARRGISNITPRITQVETEIHALKESLALLLRTGQSDLILTKATPKTKIKAHKRLPYKAFMSSDGILIWVGKSAKDNDDLSLHYARGNEWWFHIQDGPGSHVVVKNSHDVLSPNTFIEAAMLAAYFSAQKNDAKPEIIYTRVKNIKKPKGFVPGRVLVINKKSFIVQMDPERLNKILTSQISPP